MGAGGGGGGGKIVSGGGPERLYSRIRSGPRSQQSRFTHRSLLLRIVLRDGVAAGPWRIDLVRVRSCLEPTTSLNGTAISSYKGTHRSLTFSTRARCIGRLVSRLLLTGKSGT